MSYIPAFRTRWWKAAAVMILTAALLLPAGPQVALGDSTDLNGPANSGAFGSGVTVLPNGNLVVTDPRYSPPSATNAGAVYLYDGGTHDLISSLTGSQAEDQVGSGGITVLNDGSFVVKSPDWANGSSSRAGAVTWCSATLGCSGEISAENSLVGSHADDSVGGSGVTKLDGTAFIVVSMNWNQTAGAVTHCADGPGCTGTVSADNSLVGSVADDYVGWSVFVLPGDGYVVTAPRWDNGGTINAGAVIGCPMSGCIGPVTTANSSHGSQASDAVGTFVTVLKGGGFVASNTYWSKPGVGTEAGAATYCASATTCNGQAVSAANSLTGQYSNSFVGGSVLALTNGDYVVGSTSWKSGPSDRPGAATYCHVSGGMSDCSNKVISAENSLVGTHNGDSIGGGLRALAGGGYIVSSSAWNAYRGAVTFCSVSGGTSTCTGQTVSEANSLVGSSSSGDGFNGDQVSRDGLTALAGGGYVVASSFWDNGGSDKAGAVTYCPPTGCTGPVTAANSLTGSAANDKVGENWVRELTNGNYLVMSLDWANGAVAQAGAVTLCTVSPDATSSSCTGQPVSAANSLVGSTAGDQVSSSYNPVPLSNGGYVIGSPNWSNEGISNAGAITFCPASGCTGPITSANSLLGTQVDEMAGYDYYQEVEDGYYVAPNAGYLNYQGAVSLCSIETGCTAPVTSENSVIGGVSIADWTLYMTFDYDAVHHNLVVGRPAENMVTFFNLEDSLEESTTTLTTSSPGSPTTWGAALTLIAEVSPGEATGTVTFLDGSLPLCAGVALDANSQAACTTSTLSVGSHDLAAAYSGDETYAASTSDPVSHVVNKATLTVTAQDRTKVYGNEDPSFPFQYSGFVNDDDADQIDTPPSCTVGPAHTSAGTYPITCSGGADDSYSFTYTAGELTVFSRPVTVAADPKTKTYGEDDPALTYKVTSGSLVEGDSFSGALARQAGEGVGAYGVLRGSLSLGSNYLLAYVGADLEIDPKPASVTPAAAVKVYGQADPVFSGSLSGFLEADGVTAAYQRAPGETVAGGPYTISAILSPAGVLENYTITYNTASLTIIRKPASVAPDQANKIFGSADPLFSGTLTGFLPGDGVYAGYTRAAGEPVSGSPYPISATLHPAGVLGNYDITYHTADLGITKRPIAVAADPKSKAYGAPDPILTYHLTSGSLVEDDTFSGALGRAAGEEIGVYAIQQGTLALNDNYTLAFTGANLTIGKIATTTSLSSSATSPAYRQSITLTAHVAPVPPASGPVSGTVDFVEGTATLAANVPLVDGEAHLVIDNLPAGLHTVTAVYHGSDLQAESASSPVVVTIQKAAVELAITADLSQDTWVNRPYTVSVSIHSSGGTPTGIVTVSDGTDSCTFNPATGSSCLLTSTTPGKKTISAAYAGDANFAAAQAASEHTVMFGLILFPILR